MELIPQAMKEARIGTRTGRNKEISMHRLNKRADRKLGLVALDFESAMGERHVETRQDALSRSLNCGGFKHLTNLKLDYVSYENRLWSFVYNLQLTSSLDATQDPHREMEACRFVVKSTGKLKISASQWVDGGCSCSDEKVQRYLKKLSHKLIMDRIKELDMSKVEVSFNPFSNAWTITYRSIIGSTNWILIPPVMQLIKYKPAEVVKTLEFFELVFEALHRAGKEHHKESASADKKAR